MALKLFLICIGAFFTCTIVMVVVVKSFVQSFADGGKKPLYQGGFSAIVASGAAFLGTYFTTHLFALFWLFAGIFLLLGLLHVLFFHRKYFTPNAENKGQILFGEIFFMLALLFFVIVVFSSLEYFLQDKNFLFLPMVMSMLTFFIPLLLFHSFESAWNIPAAEFPVWTYPINSPIELPDERQGEKVLVIAFEICRNPTDKMRTNFRARSPETMILGDLYYHFINDLNERFADTPVQFADEDNNSFTWGFRVKPKWYQSQRILDPQLTLRENKVIENTIIICERI